MKPYAQDVTKENSCQQHENPVNFEVQATFSCDLCHLHDFVSC